MRRIATRRIATRRIAMCRGKITYVSDVYDLICRIIFGDLIYPVIFFDLVYSIIFSDLVCPIIFSRATHRRSRRVGVANRDAAAEELFRRPIHGSGMLFFKSSRNSYGKAHSVLFGVVGLMTFAWLFGSIANQEELTRFRK